MTEEQTQKPAEEPGLFLGSPDVVAYRSLATGHTHSEADGLVRAGRLLCQACIDAGGECRFGWSRPSFALVDGAVSIGGQAAREPRPSTPAYRSRRAAGRGRG